MAKKREQWEHKMVRVKRNDMWGTKDAEPFTEAVKYHTRGGWEVCAINGQDRSFYWTVVLKREASGE